MALAAVAVVVALAWAGVHRPDAPPVPLTVGTGLPGGVYHAFGEELERVTREAATPLTARETPASVANLRMVATGEIDAGFTLEDVATLAVRGEPPFDEPLAVSAVARLYDNHTHVVVRASSPFRELRDLAGARVSVGADGSGTEMMGERLLVQAGLVAGQNDSLDDPAIVGTAHGSNENPVEVVRMGLVESGRALLDGEIDAFVWSGGLPTQAVTDLAAQGPIRLLDLAEWVEPLAAAHGLHYTELPVPAGTYPGVPGVRTVGVPSLLVVRSDLPAAVAESLTRSLFEARADLVARLPAALQLHERSAIATLPVPLHPGAARYYADVKVGHSPGRAQQGG